eukprot:COSAG04_NODE_2791_length_3572_cov_1.879643_3_plen_218_part_00
MLSRHFSTFLRSSTTRNRFQGLKWRNGPCEMRTDAGLLDAAKRRGPRLGARVGIDAPNTGLDLGGDLGTLVQVIRPYTSTNSPFQGTPFQSHVMSTMCVYMLRVPHGALLGAAPAAGGVGNGLPPARRPLVCAPPLGAAGTHGATALRSSRSKSWSSRLHLLPVHGRQRSKNGAKPTPTGDDYILHPFPTQEPVCGPAVAARTAETGARLRFDSDCR